MKRELQKTRTEKATYSILEPVPTWPITEVGAGSIQRVYYVSDVKGDVGGHAHTDEDETFVMIVGSCIADIEGENGMERFEFSAGEAIECPRMVWHGFKEFSKGAVMLALSSKLYDPERLGYITDYDEFVKQKHGG